MVKSSPIDLDFDPEHVNQEAALLALAKKQSWQLTGLAPGAAALLFSDLYKQTKRMQLWVCPDDTIAQRARENFGFFAQENTKKATLIYPGYEFSPYVEVIPDQNVAMQRLDALGRLCLGEQVSALFIGATAMLPKLPPPKTLQRFSLTLEQGQIVDRDDFISHLSHIGYLRVPAVEDPGSFSVRGSIVDVFSPTERTPARIEFDDDEVWLIKAIDVESQRALSTQPKTHIFPARLFSTAPHERSKAETSLRTLCDAVNFPSSKVRPLLDAVTTGRLFPGSDGFLPAYYDTLSSIHSYLPSDVQIILLDPPAIFDAWQSYWQNAQDDHDAKHAEKNPIFNMNELLDSPEQAIAYTTKAKTISINRRDVAKNAALPFEETRTASSKALHFGSTDQRELSTALSARRKTLGKKNVLTPLKQCIDDWHDYGFAVAVSARHQQQAERLASIFSHMGFEKPSLSSNFSKNRTSNDQTKQLQIVLGKLADGFIWPQQGLVFLTEEEIFGARSHRKSTTTVKKDKAFVQDLRTLKVGDYLVHHEHGIGVYRGLEKKSLMPTRMELMQGRQPLNIEVLVIEYAENAKLFLPVTRLSQVQKFSGQAGSKPKLDRLGGQSFSVKKKRVKKAVADLADKLLRLYAERALEKKQALGPATTDFSEFEASFAYEETPDQKQAIDDVLLDLERTIPMDRVVCGDVGFGKTEVAMRAAFRVAESGKQVALICPTTVLAQQHYQSFRDRFSNYPFSIGVLSRFVPKTTQSETLSQIKKGECDIVVGTHRLLSKDVHFKNLGLLIVDEEQRFGVTHKERLKELRTHIDVLTLTATPIPRTLQLAMGGVRDLSLITTAPSDRRAVRTFVSAWDDHLISDAIRRELNRGGQCFFVYNRVEGLYERSKRLAELVPEARVAVAHAQMKALALEKIMTDFVAGEIDVLCSTAIVESGLDIPKANTIIIDHAEMLGLSQLYQLRGRVGRSKERAYCFLLAPPMASLGEDARNRLEAMERFSHLGAGFSIASLDMDQRGAGDLLGAEQSGHVAAIGFDLFVHMLGDAVALLQGKSVEHPIDPELSLDVEHYIPEDYIDDVGLRLSFYQRLADVDSQSDMDEIAEEMQERFGPLPEVARQCFRVMGLKPVLRELYILGCEANRMRITLHLSENTKLDPVKLTTLIHQSPNSLTLSPDMKLSYRKSKKELHKQEDTVEFVLRVLDTLKQL
ncbi:MAG: transcription-repair coupling factor [Myxococcales bacterium]|nr:MAG: transcription-repair coupling factor [Myxococcales bacterium]